MAMAGMAQMPPFWDFVNWVIVFVVFRVRECSEMGIQSLENYGVWMEFLVLVGIGV